MDAGIDYGLGTTNIDVDTGIRYGVIHHAELGQYWYDSSEADYGPPTCGYCGTEFSEDSEDDNGDYVCGHCDTVSSADDIYPEDPIAHTYEGDGYVMEQGGESVDIFVLKSPFKTRCRYCSPCAPGAGYIMDQDENGVWAYCPDGSWFENGKAPYTVYSVATGERVSNG